MTLGRDPGRKGEALSPSGAAEPLTGHIRRLIWTALVRELPLQALTVDLSLLHISEQHDMQQDPGA